jgi:protein gp37
MENTKIEWAHHTFNPWIGCSKVSEGCRNCYAEALMDKRYGKVVWGPFGRRQRTSEEYWQQPRRWNNRARDLGERHRVFCASLADVFEDESREELSEWRKDLFGVIDDTPHLDWLLLTKRPENIDRMTRECWPHGMPFNVWLGTSVEDQEAADRRVPLLCDVRARVHFLSAEPLLGSIKLDPRWLEGVDRKVGWVIVGGESGSDARWMFPGHARDLRDQCLASGVAFFFKQWGEWVDGDNFHHELRAVQVLTIDRLGLDVTDLHGLHDGKTEIQMYRVGKKVAGRTLDGRTWDELPRVVI